MYDIIRNKPVAQFYYKGTNSKMPIKRTVVLTETTSKTITGYEVGCGRDVIENIADAPIKSFRKDEIATVGQLRSDNALRRSKEFDDQDTTLVRMSMSEYEDMVGVSYQV